MVVSASFVVWRPISLLYVFLSLFYATTFTYFLHRFLLHRPVPGLRWAHKMHTWHHTFYQSHEMEYDDLDDVYMLLMPPWIQLVYFFLYLPLLTFLLNFVFPTDVVAHFVFSLITWYGVYEFVHWVEHLPATHPLMCLPGAHRLRRHHVLHHSKKLEVNFGIVEPSLDYLFNTKR
jgi:hypothetical protein